MCLRAETGRVDSSGVHTCCQLIAASPDESASVQLIQPQTCQQQSLSESIRVPSTLEVLFFRQQWRPGNDGFGRSSGWPRSGGLSRRKGASRASLPRYPPSPRKVPLERSARQRRRQRARKLLRPCTRWWRSAAAVSGSHHSLSNSCMTRYSSCCDDHIYINLFYSPKINGSTEKTMSIMLVIFKTKWAQTAATHQSGRRLCSQSRSCRRRQGGVPEGAVH